ncbi:MAG: hypothetical protein HQL71_13335 [Magnetococcales bacterium]|nr:hypothetical protein [Magnetococcales bacterium]
MKNKIKIALVTTSIILFIGGLVHLFLFPENGSFTTYSAAVICGFLAFIDDISYFKGGPGGLEMKRLENKIVEADELINNMRELSVSTSVPVLSLVSRLGRLNSGFSIKDKLEIRENIFSILENLKAPENSVKNANMEFDKYVIFDLGMKARKVVADAKRRKDSELNKLFQDEWPSPVSDYEGHSKAVAAKEQITSLGDDLLSLFDFNNIMENYPKIISELTASDFFDESEKVELVQGVKKYTDEISIYLETGKTSKPELWADPE